MPLLLVSYTLQFLDKQSLNFSSIMGIIDDLVSALIHFKLYTDTIRISLDRDTVGVAVLSTLVTLLSAIQPLF
jgi:hypothetical protein